jgi:hypothetical protein
VKIPPQSVSRLGRLVLLALAGLLGALPLRGEQKQPFILDMVQDNPGEPPTASAFTDPKTLARWGYTGQVLLGADGAQTFEAVAPGVVAKDSEAFRWIEARARALEQKAARAHAAGIQAYAWLQLVILPKTVIAHFKGEICDGKGRIDVSRPQTQALLRAQIAELFERCPSLDGIVVRTGEIYLHDTPYHAAGANPSEGKMQSNTAITQGPESHIAILKVLRDEVCVKRGKMVFYRTWDFGSKGFHANPDYYLRVTKAIDPHPNLVFSIKHDAGDFLRMTPFNPTLGIGRHRQIVEVQAQREAYGKGAHPYYVGDGVINGWEEDNPKRGLRDFVNSPNYAGVWTWTRGGGWGGPYITNEFWCALNAYVIAQYARNPKRTEEGIFREFAVKELGLRGEDVARFRELNLLSASAVLRGQCSLLAPVDLWWARDDVMGVPNLRNFVDKGLVAAALAEKAEAVAQWKRIESLAHQIKFRDAATQEFVETSAAYGRIKYALFEQAWTILLLGEQGKQTNKLDRAAMNRAIAAYDRFWKEWRELKAAHPSCATLSSDLGFMKKPGIGAAVNRYREPGKELQP